MSQVSQVSYGGSGTDTQAFGYNSLHELTSDTLTSGSTTVASISYGYDLNGDITSKTTTQVAGASANTYTYDQAGRLTSWNNGTTTTSYAYDGAGNRIKAGSTTYTYDARDELTSDGTSTYSYSADGDLSSVTSSSGTVTSTSDAYGQQGAQGTQSDTYDALGRDVGTTVTGGASTTLSYEGATGQLTSDGVYDYTWTPGGTLTGTAVAGSSGSGVLDLTDHHTDLTGQFTATGTTLTGSRTFGPWGATTATGGTLTGTLGYQSQYTSPATGQVDMGARWYNPATGSFGNKDAVANKPVPDSASASPFGYAADNPLGATDPTGHMAVVNINGAMIPVSEATAYENALKANAAKAAAAKAAAAKAKAAAAKIPTSCAAGALQMGNLNTCLGAVISAAGGRVVNGVPSLRGYNPTIAAQALDVVQNQYKAAVKAVTPIKTTKPNDVPSNSPFLTLGGSTSGSNKQPIKLPRGSCPDGSNTLSFCTNQWWQLETGNPTSAGNTGNWSEVKLCYSPGYSVIPCGTLVAASGDDKGKGSGNGGDSGGSGAAGAPGGGQNPGEAARALGAAREQYVADLIGGTRTADENGVGKIVIRPGVGPTDVDVIGPDGEYVGVGGPRKAGNISAFGSKLGILKWAANQAGVRAEYYLEEQTPQSAVNQAWKVLGKSNVFFFSDADVFGG
jgi:RHS repeat-associated protein